MNPDLLSMPVDQQRRSLEMAAEVIQKSDAGTDTLPNLLTADVGQTDSEVVYEENKLELHHYEPDEKRHETPIFVIYALVNRPYILDLQPDKSVIRRLQEAGFEVYMIRWGEPSLLDQSLTLDDYVNRYIKNCADAVCEREGVEDLHVLGYCMGGTMALMYDILHDDDVRTLSLMATPFVFEDTGGILEHWAAYFDPDTVVNALGNLPADFLAVSFSMMDPIDQYISKYVRLYENVESEEFVENFARMEQWIWDGVDVAGEAYREFISDIYQNNRLVKGEYVLSDTRIDLSKIDVPLQQIVGQYDHIVPAESSKPINDHISSEDQRLVEFPAGHIGISVSSSAHERLWPDVTDWLAERDVSQEESQTEPTEAERADETGASEEAAPADATGASEEAAPADATGASEEAAPADETGASEEAAPADETGASEEAAPADDAHAAGDAPVSTVRGIGPTFAERLESAGIETVADLQEHDAEELAEAADTYSSRTEDWLAAVA